MKERPPGFLQGDGEVYDYVRELHEYLWRFIRAASPGAGGCIDDVIDATVKQAEDARFQYSEWEPKAKGYLSALKMFRWELACANLVRWRVAYELASVQINRFEKEVKEREMAMQAGSQGK